MKLSIVTINLNNKAGLRKTIDSVIAQTCKDFEWIIIDGGSTDESKELIEKYADYISYWVSEPDKGIFHAMNKGILASCGEYLLFLNSGDYLYDSDVLHNVLPLLTGCDFYVGREQRNVENYIWDKNLSTTKEICLATLSFLPHQCTFIQRSIFTKYGFYHDELKFSSDWYLVYKALILGNATISKIPVLVSVFEGNGVSAINWRDSKEEREQLINELPRIKFLSDFFCNNHEFIEAIKNTKWSLFLFRIYFFIYRKWLKKTDNT